MLQELFSINNILFNIPFSGFGSDVYPISLVEFWATILGLASVIGAALNKRWWYGVGILNSIGFIAIFYQVQLYSDLLLNFYFIFMSILGLYWWSKKNALGDDLYKISYMTQYSQLVHIVVMAIAIIILGSNIDFIFNAMAVFVASILGTEYEHIPASMPYWDATTTVLSIVAMKLLAERKVEAWILWIIVDVICVGLYAYKGVTALAIEYFVFLINAIVALIFWHKFSKQQ